MAKLNRKVKEERLDVIDQMLRQGYTHSTIQVLLGREWQVTRRQVRKYIRWVYDKWDADAVEAAEDRVNQRRGQLEGVLEMALRAVPPDLKTAVQALDRLCKVDACYPTETLNVNTNVGVGVGLASMGFQTQADVRGRIEELKQRLANGGPITGYLEEGAVHGGNGKSNGKGNGHASN